jgi:hypothetical protein
MTCPANIPRCVDSRDFGVQRRDTLAGRTTSGRHVGTAERTGSAENGYRVGRDSMLLRQTARDVSTESGMSSWSLGDGIRYGTAPGLQRICSLVQPLHAGDTDRPMVMDKPWDLRTRSGPPRHRARTGDGVPPSGLPEHGAPRSEQPGAPFFYSVASSEEGPPGRRKQNCQAHGTTRQAGESAFATGRTLAGIASGG